MFLICLVALEESLFQILVSYIEFVGAKNPYFIFFLIGAVEDAGDPDGGWKSLLLFKCVCNLKK